MVVPSTIAAVTPARKASETFTGLGWVTKMIAVISCGPAIIVTASGRIAGAHLADPNHRTEVVVAGVNSAAARRRSPARPSQEPHNLEQRTARDPCSDVGDRVTGCMNLSS